MGTYHTFFVATRDELDRRFPGWKPVRAEKVVVQKLNPFTKQPIHVETWAPVTEPTPLGTPSLHDDVWGPPVPPILAVENEYMEHIEQAGAPGLRALPHFRAKNYEAFVTFEGFAAALLGTEVAVPPALVGRDDDADAPQVDALPADASRRLADSSDASMPAVARELLAAHEGSEPDDETVAYYVEGALRPLKALAIEANRRGALLCHYYALHY